MIKRRDFVKSLVTIGSGFMLTGNISAKNIERKMKIISKRPPKEERNFTSIAIEEKINEVTDYIEDEKLASLFYNCFPNTLDTTVEYELVDGKPDTFVITGDIEAMWLRDSTAQVWPYLPLIKEDIELKNLVKGLINRQTKCILIDPFANAFNKEATGGGWESDKTEMKPELHERKWELDSLCYPVRLAFNYWKITGEKDCFDEKWYKSAKLILKTIKQMQKDKKESPYSFRRLTEQATDTMPMWGMGYPTKECGLVNSYFRPSDDATIFSFLVPSNLFAIVSLRQLAEMVNEIHNDYDFYLEAVKTSNQIEKGIKENAIANHEKFGKVYAYEVDGYGNKIFMDDANIPSLLSLPYLGYCSKDDEIYQNTRRLVLSENNPYFFKGKFAEGIGGPHVGMDMIWPMSLIMRALTSDDEKEIVYCLKALVNTDANTGFMHEAFHKDNPKKYTRDWFAWANTLFGELILDIYESRRELLNKKYES